MIERCFDAARVNAYLNAPEMDFEGDLDASGLLADPRNVCLLHEGGGMLFAWRGPGVFDAHVFMFARGHEAIGLTRQMLDMMIADYGARHIWALIPQASRKVRWFARQCGMKSLGPMIAPDGAQELFEMRV